MLPNDLVLPVLVEPGRAQPTVMRNRNRMGLYHPGLTPQLIDDLAVTMTAKWPKPMPPAFSDLTGVRHGLRWLKDPKVAYAANNAEVETVLTLALRHLSGRIAWLGRSPQLRFCGPDTRVREFIIDFEPADHSFVISMADQGGRAWSLSQREALHRRLSAVGNVDRTVEGRRVIIDLSSRQHELAHAIIQAVKVVERLVSGGSHAVMLGLSTTIV